MQQHDVSIAKVARFSNLFLVMSEKLFGLFLCLNKVRFILILLETTGLIFPPLALFHLLKQHCVNKQNEMCHVTLLCAASISCESFFFCHSDLNVSSFCLCVYTLSVNLPPQEMYLCVGLFGFPLSCHTFNKDA